MNIAMDFLKILLAVFFPPVAVFMREGLARQFWIKILLTFLGGLPGILHALWILFRKK